MKQLGTLLRQVARNLGQTWGTQLMTLLTVVLSVLIFSFFFLVYMNMLRASDRLGDDIRLIVYLDSEPVPELRPQIERKIREFSEVDKIVFVSRQEAYNRLSKQLGNDRDVLADLGPAFLPPSIEVFPKKNRRTWPGSKNSPATSTPCPAPPRCSTATAGCNASAISPISSRSSW